MSCFICQGVRHVAQAVVEWLTADPDDVVLPLEPVVVRTGHIFRCENGHPMCEALANIRDKEQGWARKIGNWRQGIKSPKQGDPAPLCPRCATPVVLWRDIYGEANGYAGYVSTP